MSETTESSAQPTPELAFRRAVGEEFDKRDLLSVDVFRAGLAELMVEIKDELHKSLRIAMLQFVAMVGTLMAIFSAMIVLCLA